MAVADCCKQAGMERDRPNRRDTVGKRRSKAHPKSSCFCLHAGKQLVEVTAQDDRACFVGRRIETCKLDSPRQPQSLGHRRDRQTTRTVDQRQRDRDRRHPQLQVIAALGFEWDARTQWIQQRLRPGAGAYDHGLRDNIGLARQQLPAVGAGDQFQHVFLPEGSATLDVTVEQCIDELVRRQRIAVIRKQQPTLGKLRNAGKQFAQTIRTQRFATDAQFAPDRVGKQFILARPLATRQHDPARLAQQTSKVGLAK